MGVEGEGDLLFLKHNCQGQSLDTGWSTEPTETQFLVLVYCVYICKVWLSLYVLLSDIYLSKSTK